MCFFKSLIPTICFWQIARVHTYDFQKHIRLFLVEGLIQAWRVLFYENCDSIHSMKKESKKSFHCLDYVKKIISFSPRQLQGEIDTANFIKKTLTENDIEYKEQKYHIDVPDFKSATLLVDGKDVECSGCGLKSGTISGKYKIISSLISSRVLRYEPNISFNAMCKGAISNSNHYFAPAIAVSNDGLKQILDGTDVKAETVVEKVKHESMNILVGNTKNPKTIIFAHYDSVKTGAIDNASGVSVTMATILENTDFLEEHLFVFSGNEELSYDEEPAYWGYGFRVFEKAYTEQMEQCEKIIPIDSVGNGKNEIVTEKSMIMLGFPINNIDKWVHKVRFIIGDFDHLMTVYHSDIDDGRGMSEESLQEAKEILLQEIRN